MALEFKPADFAYPLSLLKLRAAFEKNQWRARDEQINYQERLLRRIVSHAYAHVPYYRELFDELRLRPGDIRRLADLEKIPVLTKETLSREFKRLQADNCARHRPQLLTTSGTTGRRLEFLVDKHANVQEFVYYWRHWNWAGYRLGDPLAEFNTSFFRGRQRGEQQLTHFQRVPRRLLLDSSAISDATVTAYVAAIRKHRPRFLKGLASVLYYFALFLRRKKIEGLSFKAVFSTGELLLARERRVIEETFGCKVYDSYGHMERTVAISECPQGSLHVNSDYGILELLRQADVRSASATEARPSNFTAKVIGTSLYNLSMPLLRYDVGDLVTVSAEDEACACGRQFPRVRSIDGRQNDVVITPDGQVLTAMFLVFEEVPGLLAGQISQESLDELLVSIAPSPRFTRENELAIVARLRGLVGAEMKISIRRCAAADLLQPRAGKYQVVVSKLTPPVIT